MITRVSKELYNDNIVAVWNSILNGTNKSMDMVVKDLDGASHHVLTGTELQTILERKHNHKDVILPITNTDDKFTALCEALINVFEKWIAENQDNFAYIYDALHKKYDPLENYDRYEDSSTSYLGNETDRLTKSGSEADTLTKSGTEADTLVMAGTETDTLLKTGKEVSREDFTGSETDTLTKTGTETDTLTKTGSEKHTISNGAHTDHKYKSASPESAASTDISSATFYASEKETEVNATKTDTDTLDFTNRSDTDTKSFTNRSDANTKTFNNRANTTEVSFNARSDANTKSFTNRSDTNTKSFTDRVDESVKSFTDRVDESVKSFTNRHDDTISHIHGNIGVTTSQQMVQSTFDVYCKPHFELLFDEFINSCCTYLPRC